MSFSSDPFRTIDLVIADPDQGVSIRCSSCGGETDPVPLDTPVSELLLAQHQHARRSHRLEPKDTEGWSV